MRIHLAFTLALFNMMAQRAARVLVTLYALALGAEPVMVGLVGATFAFVPAVLSFHAGRITDRFGARWPLMVGASLAVVGLVLPYFVPTIAALFAGGLLCGLGATFYNLSLQNLIGVLSTPADRARNYSNFTMVISVATSIGPVLAGIAIDHGGHARTFLLIAALLVVPVVLLALWGGTLPRGGKESGTPQRIVELLTQRGIWPVLAGSSIAQSGLELFQIYMPVYAHGCGLSASSTGIIMAMAAIGGFGARIILTRLIERSNEGMVLAGALFLGAASFVLVPFSANVVALSAIALVFGAGLNCSQPLTLIQIFNRSQAGRSGELLGLRFAIDNVVRLVSPILFGMLASGFGIGAVFWVSSVLLGGGGVMCRADAARSSGKHPG